MSRSDDSSLLPPSSIITKLHVHGAIRERCDAYEEHTGEPLRRAQGKRRGLARGAGKERRRAREGRSPVDALSDMRDCSSFRLRSQSWSDNCL